MNKISKKIIAVIAVLLGAVSLVGCGSNTQKASYSTSGLSEKKAGKVKFYTSKSNDWKESITDKVSTFYILDIPNTANISIMVSSDEKTIKPWNEFSQDSIKKELGDIGAKNVEVKDVELSGKKAYRTTYEIAQSNGDRYYVNLDGKHVAIVTYVKKQGGNDPYQKEVENIVNTIEYVN